MRSSFCTQPYAEVLCKFIGELPDWVEDCRWQALSAIYCKESQFEQVKAHYSNPSNYNYYIGRYLEDDTSVLLDKNDEEYAERAIKFLIDLDSTFGVGGIFDPFEDRKITVDVEFLDWDRVTIYRISKDGFFTTLHMELAIYNGTLYRHVSSDDSRQA